MLVDPPEIRSPRSKENMNTFTAGAKPGTYIIVHGEAQQLKCVFTSLRSYFTTSNYSYGAGFT